MTTTDALKLPLDEITTSDAACRVLCEVARTDASIWLLTADVMRTTQTKPFADAYPDRFLNLGIVEQAMVGVAAGLATCGKTPVVAAFAAMLSMRACEQIRTDLAYADLNVKILASSAGLAAGYAGPTHHSLEDLAILRAMANMTVVVPCDAEETREAVLAALHRRGPVYIRLGRAAERRVHAPGLGFQIGRAIEVAVGSDVTLIGCGRTVAECVIAARLLRDDGIGARVLDLHTVKPIDVAAVEMAASQTRMVFTVEEHTVMGGLGGAVAEVMAELGVATPLKRLGMPDSYAVIGSTDALFDRYGLTGRRIAETVAKSLSAVGRR
jgi:transketolase